MSQVPFSCEEGELSKESLREQVTLAEKAIAIMEDDPSLRQEVGKVELPRGGGRRSY